MSKEIKTDSSAIASLWMGILGVSVFPVVLSVPAFFTARDAKKRIKASEGQLGGYELARTGWWLGLIGMLAGALVVVGIVGELIKGGGEL